MNVCGLSLFRICGLMVVASGLILIMMNLPLQVDNRLLNPPYLKSKASPMTVESKRRSYPPRLKSATSPPPVTKRVWPNPLHSKRHVPLEEVKGIRGSKSSNQPSISSKTSPPPVKNKRTPDPLPPKSTKSPQRVESKRQLNLPHLSSSTSPPQFKDRDLPNPPKLKQNAPQLKQNAPPQSRTKAAKIKRQKCVPKPDCVRLNYPILRQIKEGIVKPSDKPRSVYLNMWGRFGNHLYQLGGLLGLSRATCSSIKIYSKNYNLSTIFRNLPFTVLSKSDFDRETSNIPHINLKENPGEVAKAYASALKEDIRLSFSFMSFSWFDGCEKYARYSLRLKDGYVNKAKKIIRTVVEEHAKGNATTIGVHIRRGDRATQRLYAMGYRVPQKSYFNKAMSYFREKYKNALFIITTDDREWVTENFPNNKYPDEYLAPKNNFETDFTLLTKCDYVIQSVGTFSRWAAFLNGHESVHYRYELLQRKLNSTQSPYQGHWRTMVN